MMNCISHGTIYHVDNVNDAVLFANTFNTLFQLRADQGNDERGRRYDCI